MIKKSCLFEMFTPLINYEKSNYLEKKKLKIEADTNNAVDLI